MGLKGYKVFDKNLQCRGYQFEVGKIFKHKGEIIKCQAGFHFCIKAADCFGYYAFSSENRICEVEATDKFITDGDKTVCNEIKIIRELTWQECLTVVNTGKDNTGFRNSGNYNSGDYNSGNYNSGDYNSGNYNSGYYNSGNYNSGYRNSGNYNSGNYNSGNYNSGYFNSNESKWIRLFNKYHKLDHNNEKLQEGLSVLYSNFWDRFTVWVPSNKMTDIEKEQAKHHTTTGGYLRTATYKEAWSSMWENLSKESKQKILNIPGFKWKVFTEITGIEKE